MKIGSLRSSLGVVLQEPFFFATTIRENLLYGNQEAAENEMFEAARKVGLKTIATFHEPPGEMYESAREFYPEGLGANDPKYADLYAVSDFSVLNKKLLEVVDKYRPDQIWFEDAYCGEENWKAFIAYYYNKGQEWRCGRRKVQ